jgi:hypothetical protein
MDEPNATPDPAPSSDPPPSAAEAGSAVDAVPGPAAAVVVKQDEPEERERWFRERFEKEHEVTLALMRLLLAGLTSQSRPSRFWRWLIDDFRSERRLLADRHRESNEERILINRVLAWFREQAWFGSRRGAGGHVEGSGP